MKMMIDEDEDEERQCCLSISKSIDKEETGGVFSPLSVKLNIVISPLYLNISSLTMEI